MTKLKSASEYENLKKQIISSRDPKKLCVTVCSGTGCQASGCERLNVAFQEELAKQKLTGKVDIKRTGCHGFCEKGPIVIIYPEEICYLQVQPNDASEIISQTVVGGKTVDRLLYVDPKTGERIVHESDIPFYKNQ